VILWEEQPRFFATFDEKSKPLQSGLFNKGPFLSWLAIGPTIALLKIAG